ncbi:hypothetical protein TCON_2288 [Astathelohania contejeani]|uniref:Uncharacterized protein n=1 Tax=Astathelohania contejeani TaxID=164912 RepID=A0ABQ7HWI5_9MICR|nr:hypothetical protein TCON_2288 [Thelohania contejeani]
MSSVSHVNNTNNSNNSSNGELLIQPPPPLIQLLPDKSTSIRKRQNNSERFTRSSLIKDRDEQEKIMEDDHEERDILIKNVGVEEKLNDTEEIQNDNPSFKMLSKSLKQKKITTYINYQMEKILLITIFILFLISLWENNWILGLTVLLTIFIIKPTLSKIIAGWLIDIPTNHE